MNDEELENKKTEVVEQATEKLVGDESNIDKKTYTQEEIDKLVNEKVDAILPGKIERAKNKLKRENQEKMEQYQRIENILAAGLDTHNLDETEEKIKNFYESQGVKIPERTEYSRRDLEVLVTVEANDIISSGYDDIVEEVDRLASKGTKNMTEREKILFTKLVEERKRQESLNDLVKSGINIEVLKDKDYQEFTKKLNPAMSEKDKYEMYEKYKPKTKQFEPLGSMKTIKTKDTEVKEYYSYEEAKKFTRKDFDNNPELYKAVCDSMTKWGK